jgi:hypothetical protein
MVLNTYYNPHNNQENGPTLFQSKLIYYRSIRQVQVPGGKEVWDFRQIATKMGSSGETDFCYTNAVDGPTTGLNVPVCGFLRVERRIAGQNELEEFVQGLRSRYYNKEGRIRIILGQMGSNPEGLEPEEFERLKAAFGIAEPVLD